MGMLSALNPLTFGRKNQAAWNAYMAAYTFSRLSSAEQNAVIGIASDLVEAKLRCTLIRLLQDSGQVVLLNFLVYGMRELGIRPALGNELWFHITNPIVACLGVEEVLDFQRRQMEKQFGVQFELDPNALSG